MRAIAQVVLAVWFILAGAVVLAAPPSVPVIIDTDIGFDIDDALALALAVSSPELVLVAVTTVGGQAEDRAWLACRFLTLAGVPQTPAAFGRPPQPDSIIDGQIQYRRHPAVVFNRTQKPVSDSAVELMYRQLKARPGQV